MNEAHKRFLTNGSNALEADFEEFDVYGKPQFHTMTSAKSERAISLKEALAARLFATHGANSKGVAITYLFDTVLRTFFCWRSAYRR